MSVTELGEMLVRYKADISDLTSNVKSVKSDMSSVSRAAEDSSDKVTKSLKKEGDAAKETGGGFKHLLGSALDFAGNSAVFAGLGILKDQLGSVFQESLDAQAGMANTNAVLKSTHGVSGMTADAVANLASDLSHLTKFSDDTVQSGENMLLTFTNIGQKVFPDATKTVLDMSQALGQDTKSSAIQLGKALNDPFTGITALSRVGVTFTQQQKDSIKTFMAHNDIISAQKVILTELSHEFGGQAVAAGKTFEGQMAIAHQRLADVKQMIGDFLMPVVTRFLSFITGPVFNGLGRLGAALQSLGPFFQPFISFFQYAGSIAGKAMKDVGDTLTQVGQIFKGVFSGIGGTGDNPIVMFFSDLMGKAYPLIGQFGAAFHGFMMTIQKNLSTINPQDILNVFSQIGNAFTSFVSVAKPIFQQIGDIIGGQLKQDFHTFLGVAQSLATWWQSTMAPAIQQAMPGFVSLGKTIFTQILPALVQLWADGHKIADALIPVIVKAFETFAPIVVKVAGFIAGRLAPAIQFLAPYVVQAAGEVVKFAQDIATRVMPIITGLGELIGILLDWLITNWPAIWGVLAPVVMAVFNTIKGVIQIAWSIITGIFKIALDLISGNWSGVWNDMKDMFSGIWDGIVSIAKGGIDMVIGAINEMIGGINSINIDMGPVQIHPHIPTIPMLATGGMIQSSGLAFVHQGEVVVPAAQTASLNGSNGLGGGGQTFILEVDGAQLAQIVNTSSDRLVRLKLGSRGRAA